MSVSLQPNDTGVSQGKLMYTFNKPPSEELVGRMKAALPASHHNSKPVRVRIQNS